MARLHSLPPIESDPVMATVQKNLTMGGGEISALVKSGAAPTGSEIMNVVHLMASGQPYAAPVTTKASSSSSLAPAIGAGAAGLAVGAVAGAALSSSGAGTGAAASATGKKAGAKTEPELPAKPPTPSAKTDPIPPPGGGPVPEPPTKAPPPPVNDTVGKEFAPGGLTLTPLAGPPNDLALP